MSECWERNNNRKCSDLHIIKTRSMVLSVTDCKYRLCYTYINDVIGSDPILENKRN